MTKNYANGASAYPLGFIDEQQCRRSKYETNSIDLLSTFFFFFVLAIYD